MNDQNNTNTISICMGSSCFARGNRKSLEIIQDYIEQNKCEFEIELSGCLCHDKCKSGPNIEINGQLHEKVEPNTVIDLLTHSIK
ncbi:MAG: (2Fe-2S) ferredoxin domain-containing protein [Rhodothermaceae bacterium]